MPDDLDLDALKALTDAATEGPWQAWGDGLVWAARPGDPVSGSTVPADAHFIAAARTAVPALIAEVERLRRERATMTEVAQGNKRHVAVLAEYCEQVEAERDRRGDELQRAQAVVDAAKEWRGWMRLVDEIKPGGLSGPSRALYAAVDALEAPVPQPQEWAVRHPGIGVLAYDSETEARTAAGTAGTVLHHHDNTWTPA